MNNKKKAYNKPKIEIHGNLKNITKAKGNVKPDAGQKMYAPSLQ